MKPLQVREGHEDAFMMHVFAIFAGMVGVCLTAIGILRLVTSQDKVQTVGDDLLAVDSVLFLVCCFLSFWSFKSVDKEFRQRLRVVVDTILLLALVIMACVCCVIAYAIV
jgi:hypothetical protein